MKLTKNGKQKQSLDYSEIAKQLKTIEKSKVILKAIADEELIICIKDLRLPTLNELFATMQYRKVVVYNYKKQVKEMMSRFFSSFKNDDDIYFFDDAVDMHVFRCGVKLIDNDSLPASLKYFTDSLVENNILRDDNPKFLKKIYCYQATNKEISMNNTIIIKLVKSKEKENIEFKNEEEVFNFFDKLK